MAIGYGAHTRKKRTVAGILVQFQKLLPAVASASPRISKVGTLSILI